MTSTRPPETMRRAAFVVGQVVQGLIAGSLLFFAILGLIALSGNVTVFRYQGY